MSYAAMDHALWVERHNKNMKSIYAGRKGKRYEKLMQAPDSLSPFQARVMDILGITFGGIYNAPISWHSTDWDYGRGVSVVLKWAPPFASFDSMALTLLVFLCHEARIRCEVTPGGWRSFRLSFWQRGHEGGLSKRHPNIEEAVASFRAYLPEDHRIIYKPETKA